MGKTKKKVVYNRGVSTVSVPAKKREEEPIEEVATENATTASGDTTVPAAASNGSAAATTSAGQDAVKVIEEWTPELAEKHQLQLLMDKIRAPSEKEVSRVSKVIDYERRLAKTMPAYLWAETDLQRRIIETAISNTAGEIPQPSPETEDKLVAKVTTIFGILEQLGFAKERAEQCLRAVKNLELEDALDWLFLHCDSSELRCEGPIVAPLPFTEVPISRPIPSPASIPTSPPPRINPVSTTARNTTPKNQSRKASVDEPAMIDSTLRAKILAYDEDDSDSGSANDSSIIEDSEANIKWVGYKIQLSEVQRAQNVAKRSAARGKIVTGEKETLEAKVVSLGKKMKTVEADYIFRRVDAEKLFKEERIKLDASQLSARLSTTEIEPPSPFARSQSSTPRSKSNTTSNTSPTTESAATSADGASSTEEKVGEEEGMFGGLLEEMPLEATNDQGTTIAVQDMALPKNFSGKSPRNNLEETVRKLDKFATVTFATISRSRAFRASVSIRWDGGRTQYFDMQEIACCDSVQAYNYIATVALFSVGQQTGTHKLLPIQFKDLWDELMAARIVEEENQYRETLKKFQSIAELRVQPASNKDSRINKIVSAVEIAPKIMPVVPISRFESEAIMDEFYARQQWPTYQDMLQHRATLPIAAYRSHIMSIIDSSQCVVLCGETGCGKSTQVPSFILEHGMAQGKPIKIYCTEPRRISAISLAQRVSSELGEAPGACGSRSSYVGYSIRLDSRVSPSSKIIYATTGIVLRMLEGTDSLADATHLIIDEVHERSIDSDFLLIVLKEILEIRKDLKVILMSATVDADKIAAYMGNNTPVIHVPGRTFPVTARWLEDVVEMTGYKLEPNTDSPYVARNMRNAGGRPRKPSIQDDVPPDDDESDQEGPSDITYISKQSRLTIDCMDHHAINYDLILLLLENLCFYKSALVPFSTAILIFLPSLESIRKLCDLLEGHEAFGSKEFLVLPLHSTISNENQGLVFEVPPQGIRKIVISTNLAETGVTIPDITAVIDSGKHREMRFDEKRQISRLVETFVAQSNASQRRGRAGRVQEGICFHLFTKSRHDSVMAEHPQPEITRLSLQELSLRIKTMKIAGSIEEVLLKALDPPLSVNIQRAVASLIEAKALTATEEITPLGRHLGKLPMDVHLGKFLIMSCLFGCVDAALTITAALNSKSPWLTPFGRESEADAVKRSFKVENSDFLTLYNAYCSWREASSNGYEREFCRKSFLSQQNFQMIEELRQQYFSFLVDVGFVQATVQEKRELISTRYGRSKVRFVRVPDEMDGFSKDPKAVMACIAASLYPKLLVVDSASNSMKTLANSATAAIHPSSVNFTPGRRNDFAGAKFVAFFTAMATKKLYVWESGSVDERAVYLLCGTADFQLPAHSLTIDRKIRVRLEPKTSIAMKLLRTKFNHLFAAKMKNPGATMSAEDAMWLELIKESLVTKAEAPRAKAEQVRKVKISLVKH